MILSRLVGDRRDAALFVMRVVIGLLFIAHGLAKLQAPMGVQSLATGLGAMGFPGPLMWAWIVVLVEAIGGLFLVLGIFTRVSALLVGVIMVVAVIKVKWAAGLISAPGKGLGLDYPIVYLLPLIAIFLQGPGRYSIEGSFKKELS